MRIVLAVHAFPPRSVAGVEVYTLRLAQGLRARGHDVHVLAAVHDLDAPPGAVRRRSHAGVDVVEIVSVHAAGTLEATYDDPVVDAAGAAVFDELRPECVHFQHLLNLSSGLVAAARRAGARTVFTLHDYWLSCPRDGLRMREDLSLCQSMDHRACAACLAASPYLAPPLQRGLAGAARRLGLGRYLHRLHDVAPAATEGLLRLLRRTVPEPGAGLAEGMDRRARRLQRVVAEIDLVLAPTAFARDRALEFGVAASKVQLCPYGVLTAPAQPRAAGRRLRFGFIGTVAPHKGVHVLVDAFRAVADPAATLDVHGSLTVQPAYVAQLRRAAEGDPRIHLRGPFAEGGQAAALAQLDVLVVPSLWWENSPLVVLEALGAGVAVVASRTGGVPELLSEGDGLLVPPGDARALGEALAAVARGDRLSEAREAPALKTSADEAAVMESLYH